MILETRSLRIFIYQQPIDMRYGFEKLSYFVREKMKAEISAGHLFLFLGKNRKRMKALYFDGSGLLLTSKRLEKANFMSTTDLGDIKEISLSELKLLVHGSVLRKPVLERMMRVRQTKNADSSLPVGLMMQSPSNGERERARDFSP